MAASITAYFVNSSLTVVVSDLMVSHSEAGENRMFFALSTRFIILAPLLIICRIQRCLTEGYLID